MLLRHRTVSVELSIRLTVASSCTTMVQDIWIFICRGKTRSVYSVRARLSGTVHTGTGRMGYLPYTIRWDAETAKELITLAYNDDRKITAFRKQRSSS